METPLLISTSTKSSHLLVKLHLLRDLHYLENFFQTQALIASFRSSKSTVFHSHHHLPLLLYLRIRLYQWLMTAAAIICFTRVYTQERHSYLMNIALYNMAFIEGFRGHWNVWLGGFALLTVYYFQLAYFKSSEKSCSISSRWLVTVLIYPGKPAHFLWSYFEWPRFLQKRGVGGGRSEAKEMGRRKASQHQLTLVEYFRASAVFVLNAFHLAFACNVLYYLSVQLRIISAFRRQHLFEDFFGLAAFALFEVAALITHCVIHIGLQSMVPFGVLGVTLMRMFRVRLSQIANLVEDLHRRSSSRRGRKKNSRDSQSPLHQQLLLNSFLRANDFTVKVIPDISAIYGRALFALLLVGLPSNAILVMLLVSSRRVGQLTITIRVLFTVIYLFEVVFIFLVHTSLSLIVIKTHAPVRRMMALFAVSCFCCCRAQNRREEWHTSSVKWKQDLKAKLKLTRYFEQFHSRNQFALNYGGCGKITIRSFSRQLVYYTKLVFFAYKMVSF